MTNAPEPGIVAGIRQALEDCEPVSEDEAGRLLDAYDDVVNQRDAEAAARRVLRDELTAARQAYELKVQDLAKETARLGELIDVLAAHGHSADDTSRRCLACSICRTLREVTGAGNG